MASAIEAQLAEQGVVGRVRILETFDALQSKEHHAQFLDALRVEMARALVYVSGMAWDGRVSWVDTEPSGIFSGVPAMKRKALLKVGYSCNNNCIFCHSASLKWHPDLTTDEVEARVGFAKDMGAEMIVFSGGEPTIRGDIVDLARIAHARDLGVGLITNGRRFVYHKFGEQMVSLGLGYAHVSFHAPTRQAHQISARTDSFHQTLGAICNLVKLGVTVTVNTVVTKYNIDDLRGIVDMLGALRPGTIKLSVVEPKGNVLDDTSICPPLSASAGAIADAVRYGRSKYRNILFGCEGLTPCLLEDFESTNDDLFTNGFLLFQNAFERRMTTPDYGNRAKSALCIGCAESDRCPGVFERYLAMDMPPPLRPMVPPPSQDRSHE